MNLRLEEFPTHYFICRRLIEISNQAMIFSNFEGFQALLSQDELDVMDHKIIRRLKYIEDAALVTTRECGTTDETCCICMDVLPANVRKTKCDHEFCVQCFDTWFEKNTTCPICKRDYSEDNEYDLIDTQTMEIVGPSRSGEDNNGTRLSDSNAPIVRSIIRRLDIIGNILDNVQ